MNLPKRLIEAQLATDTELAELRAILTKPHTVRLKRTFNQSDFKGGYIKFWRVMNPPSHPRYQSDLSIEGLQEAGII